MSNNISIKSINELLGMNFFIPSYQRGYRWTEQQVEDLLDDINEFDSTNGKWYCLQPLVVKEIQEEEKKKYALKSKENDNKWYEVIDGQQRLTTIFLIIHYFNEKRDIKPKINESTINYETRKDSSEFLREVAVGTDDKVNIDNTNIDYWHISSAYATIHKWVKNKGDFGNNDFQSKFKCLTKVIWYETPDADSIDIFTRINSGKIPLTNAELIKALFLNSSNFPNADTKKLHLKQLEIASEWDRMEYALQDDSFWYFINKDENEKDTRIEFLFELIVGKPTNKDDDTYTFRKYAERFQNKSEKQNGIEENWKEVKRYFQTLEEWYNDRELYHKIGYLIAVGTNIKNILKEKIEISKTEFSNWINQEIESKFKNVNLEEVEYNGRYVREILLLHNIQTMLNNENETNRFPFDRYKKESWDVEHIHAIATEVNMKIENQVQWLKNNFIKTDNHQNKELNNRIKFIKSGNTIDENEFEGIIDYVLGEEDNSLQNLCLLDRRTNRSYKNDSFREKRRKIIKREIEGTFIPICTKNVFMKYYSTNVKDIEVWNETDRTSYSEKIQDVISQYLPKTKAAENEQ